jgi:hypothetical protein
LEVDRFVRKAINPTAETTASRSMNFFMHKSVPRRLGPGKSAVPGTRKCLGKAGAQPGPHLAQSRRHLSHHQRTRRDLSQRHMRIKQARGIVHVTDLGTGAKAN